jgi:DNA-binding NarL/FixJ family response regulator
MFLLEALKSLPAPVELTEIDSSTLTKRELQVVQCAATGQTNKAIASELGLSEHTVKNYLFRAFEKLGVSSRVELLFYLTVRGHSFSPRKVEPKEAKAPRETRVAV